MEPVRIDTYYPADELLQRHIAYCYFLSTDSPSYRIRFHVYPQLQVPVTIHSQASYDRSGAMARVQQDRSNPYLTLCNGLLKGPLEAEISGIQTRITIVFQPLGINHFIDKPYEKLIGRGIQVFDGWKGDDYNAFLDAFFKEQDHQTQLALLESFLLRRYRPLPHEDQLRMAVRLLTDFDQDLSIPQVAEQCGFTERTLNRLFRLHFSASPVQLRKIARFRKTLELKSPVRKGSLSGIAYGSNYYDQSHFIASYREMTGIQPARFFKSVTNAADDHIWMRVLD